MYIICRRRGVPGNMRLICARNVLFFVFWTSCGSIRDRAGRLVSMSMLSAFQRFSANSLLSANYWFCAICGNDSKIDEVSEKTTPLTQHAESCIFLVRYCFWECCHALIRRRSALSCANLQKCVIFRKFRKFGGIRICGKPGICGNHILRNLKQRLNFSKS